MAKIKVLRVVSRSASFRRAGRQFTATPTDIPLSELKADEREVIENDAELVAYETEADAPEPDAEAKGNKTKK